MQEGLWTIFVGPVLTVLGVLILAVASLAWRTVLKIEKKMDTIVATESACREDLKENYVRLDFLNARIIDPLTLDRRDKWEAYDKHTHDPISMCVIKK